MARSALLRKAQRVRPFPKNMPNNAQSFMPNNSQSDTKPLAACSTQIVNDKGRYRDLLRSCDLIELLKGRAAQAAEEIVE